jgi:hypothetical protein
MPAHGQSGFPPVARPNGGQNFPMPSQGGSFPFLGLKVLFPGLLQKVHNRHEKTLENPVSGRLGQGMMKFCIDPQGAPLPAHFPFLLLEDLFQILEVFRLGVIRRQMGHLRLD